MTTSFCLLHAFWILTVSECQIYSLGNILVLLYLSSLPAFFSMPEDNDLNENVSEK